MKKILMIICCLMMSLGISAQKNFVYGIYDVQTKKGVGGSYIIDLKNKKFLPDCDGGEYSDCGDMKNVKTVGDVTTFDWYNSDGSFGGRGKVGKLKDGRPYDLQRILRKRLKVVFSYGYGYRARAACFRGRRYDRLAEGRRSE